MQSRFHNDDDGDLHEQILRNENYIEELANVVERCRKIILVFKIRRWCRRNPDLGNNHGSDRIQCHSHDRGNCGCPRRDGYFWIKREYPEANYDRDESRRGTQGRVDQQNGSSGGRRRQDRKLTDVRSSSFRTEAESVTRNKTLLFLPPASVAQNNGN